MSSNTFPPFLRGGFQTAPPNKDGLCLWAWLKAYQVREVLGKRFLFPPTFILSILLSASGIVECVVGVYWFVRGDSRDSVCEWQHDGVAPRIRYSSHVLHGLHCALPPHHRRN